MHCSTVHYYLDYVLGHIAISQLILKIMSWNSAYKWISILWSQIWHHIFNMKSLWCHYDVIFEKLVKRLALSAEIHIFIESVSQIILFLADTSLIAHFFLICVKKARYLKDSWKNRTLFVIKTSIMLLTSSKQGKHLLFWIWLFQSKAT